MEVDKIESKSRKFQRIGNDGVDSKKLGQNCKGEDGGGGVIAGGVVSRLCGWPSSRIVRVSRASGGKDRHSKVWTSKGLRDRRVRLSVTTAIQFYDLQDRLGYDQPSKAIEWLLKKAADSISELPSLDASFPDTPKQTENGDTDVIEFNQQTACSSTSETSKGSAGLSVSRSENRIKARERARERAAEKEKEKETESQIGVVQQNQQQNSSFTELLTGINTVTNDTHNVSGSSQMDYFINPSQSSRTHPSLSSWGNNSFPGFNIAGDQNPNPNPNQFSFVNENLVPIVSSTTAGEYNLNFSISSRLAGFNRGTLQSNTPSFYPHIQRFSPLDGSNLSSFSPLENHNHHQFYQTGFDGRLQLRFGDNVSRYSDQKGKEKN